MSAKVAPKIGASDFKRILDGLEIVSVEVDEFQGKVNDRESLADRNEPRLVKLRESSQFNHLGNGETLVWHAYKLTVEAKSTKKRLFELMVKFRVRYACSEEFDEEFFAVFKSYSLRLQTGPFARAWIHDHCLRLGVDPLILPLVRSK